MSYNNENYRSEEWLSRIEDEYRRINIKHKDISDEEILKIDSKDIKFISKPGRMGDDGITVVTAKDNEMNFYYINGNNDNEQFLEKVFPNLFITEAKKGYKYLYCGFGSGLYIKEELYDDFIDLLDIQVMEAEGKCIKNTGFDFSPGIIYACWEVLAYKVLKES